MAHTVVYGGGFAAVAALLHRNLQAVRPACCLELAFDMECQLRYKAICPMKHLRLLKCQR